MKEPIVLIILSLLGVVSHCLLRIGSLKKDYAVANKDFNWKNDWLYKDYVAIGLSLVASFAWYFLFGEVAAKYPALEGFTRCSFFVMGGMGSYVAQLFFGVSKKYIRKVVDIKTNIADSKEPSE
jgi:hypothetical protein